MKPCNKCKEVKPLDAFCKDRSLKSGLASICRSCNAVKNRRWREGMDHKKEHRRKVSKRYNLKPGEYDRKLEMQGGVCMICGQADSKRLAVDHNHTTGKVRGLLCSNCNRALGHFKEDLDIIRAAVDYLKDHE